MQFGTEKDKATLNTKIKSGSVTWRSPSNIALIKYWGKYGHQLPKNPSLSITLNNAYSETSIDYFVKESVDTKVSLEFSFEGDENQKFRNRILKYLTDNISDIPFIQQLNLFVKSKNSFPHSSGIASSASSMSALALCLVSIEEKLSGVSLSDQDFNKRASDLARKASGSACRSIYPKMGLWGATDIIPQSSEQHAIGYSEFHNSYDGFHDDILIVSPFEKKVSSSEGHRLMDKNRFANERYVQANENLKNLIKALKNGNIWEFGKIVEDEALVLHALMMCSDPSYILLEANTLNILKGIRHFRKENNIPIFFSLDAGPNVHVLYPHRSREKAKDFIQKNLKEYCFEGKIIEDFMGNGPILIQENVTECQ